MRHKSNPAVALVIAIVAAIAACGGDSPTNINPPPVTVPCWDGSTASDPSRCPAEPKWFEGYYFAVYNGQVMPPPAGQQVIVDSYSSTVSSENAKFKVQRPDYLTFVRATFQGSPDVLPSEVLAADTRQPFVLRTLPKNFVIPPGVDSSGKVVDMERALRDATTPPFPGQQHGINNTSLLCSYPFDGKKLLDIPRWDVDSIPYGFVEGDGFTEDNKNRIRTEADVSIPRELGQKFRGVTSAAATEFGIVVRKNPNLPVSGQRDFLVTQVTGRIIGAQVTLRDFFPVVIKHEIGGHGLGLCHNWARGVMNANGQSSQSFTSQEVAVYMATTRRGSPVVETQKDVVANLNAITSEEWEVFYRSASGGTSAFLGRDDVQVVMYTEMEMPTLRQALNGSSWKSAVQSNDKARMVALLRSSTAGAGKYVMYFHGEDR